MKNLDPRNWPGDTDPLKGVQLFAQLWEEMLFDHSLDSHRVRTLNLPGLCAELIETCQLCQMHILSQRCLLPLCEELLHVLRRDSLAKTIIGERLGKLSGIIQAWGSNSRDYTELGFAASAMLKLLDSDYQDLLVEGLLEAASDPTRKARTAALAGTLLTEVLRRGFSPRYVYTCVKARFFGETRVDSADDLRRFLSPFIVPDHKHYEVVFSVPRRAINLARNANPEFLRFEPQMRLRLADDETEQRYQAAVRQYACLVFPAIRARDAYAARGIAEERLRQACAFVTYLLHKMHVFPSREVLVYEGDPPTSAVIVDEPKKATMKRPEVRGDERFQAELAKMFGPFISRSTEEAAKQRLLGALEAHVAGVHARAPVNQFANLWTALETLVCTSAEQNTLNAVLDRSTPMLCLKYFVKLMHRLRLDIRSRLREAYQEVLLVRRDGESELRCLTRVVADEETEPQRRALYAACEFNPLLRNRIRHYHDTLCSARRARKVLDEHERRVRWHIQRMYRVRNQLVHAGRIDVPYLEMLVENLHTYVDHILAELVEGLRDEPHHNTLEKVFFECSTNYEAYRKMVYDGQTSRTPGEVARLVVFGETRFR